MDCRQPLIDHRRNYASTKIDGISPADEETRLVVHKHAYELKIWTQNKDKKKPYTAVIINPIELNDPSLYKEFRENDDETMIGLGYGLSGEKIVIIEIERDKGNSSIVLRPSLDYVINMIYDASGYTPNGLDKSLWWIQYMMESLPKEGKIPKHITALTGDEGLAKAVREHLPSVIN